MAVRPIVPTKLSRGSHRWEWNTLLNGDTGAPLDADQGCPNFADKTVHVKGNFTGPATIVIEGSNDGVTWVTLTDPAGALLSFTSEDLKVVLENPQEIRPRVSAGGGSTDLDVFIIGRGILQLR